MKKSVFCFLLLVFGPMVSSSYAQTGPMIGTVTNDEARFLYRPGSVEKSLRVTVLGPDLQIAGISEAQSRAADDYVAKFHVRGLRPETSYTYKIEDLSGSAPLLLVGPDQGLHFKTRTPRTKRNVVTAAFASCANSTSEPVWQRIGMLAPDLLVLAGDTPYVDVADLATARLKQRSFLETPFLASLVRGTPVAATWDDHDFGLNGGNGVNTASRRDNTRKAFVEYRNHDQYGNGTDAVYHKVDLGVMEIFLLDPRWFSQTGPSPVDPTKPTCFGIEQLKWIRDSLRASKAPFKVLAFGEVWQDKKNSENDDMFTYWYERDAVLDFIREESIPGVMLLGGDIHVSRHLVHPQRVGYDLHDFVTSPAHTSVIPSLDVPHPSLEWSLVEPRQFLTLTADTRSQPAVLTARYYLADGTVKREVVVPYDKLEPKTGKGLGKGLRAWWNFDGDFKNRSVLGERVDATPVSGASLEVAGGLRGGALSLKKTSEQYLHVERSALDDNTVGYTASIWCKPTSLPANGSSERHFLMESTLGSEVSADLGHAISIGFRSAATPDKINLELYTSTLKPAVSASTASPTAIAQGGFSCLVDRSIFTDRWTHVVITSDGSSLRLYVNGIQNSVHVLPIPGPTSETGGLVIGGHREGAGRNFDGLLDEIALWTRALSPDEVGALYHGGIPVELPVEVSAIDSDNDTLEDWWEDLHGLDKHSIADASSDLDQDSVPAWIERQAGTDPLNDDSGLYEYVRGMGSGSARKPMAFRDPGTGTVSLYLRGEESNDLKDWNILKQAAGSNASADPTGIHFELNQPFAPWFFRVGVSE